MGLSQTIEPFEEPVTTADLKTHLRIEHTNDDDYIAALGKAGREFAENFTERQFVTATYVYTLDNFPAGRLIVLPRPPLASVTSVKYYDTAEVLQTYANTCYNVHIDTEPGFIELDYDQTWPSTYDRADAVQVTFTAGYGAAGNVPDGLKAAIHLIVANWYENREPVVTGTTAAKLPLSVEALLWSYRILEVR